MIAARTSPTAPRPRATTNSRSYFDPLMSRRAKSANSGSDGMSLPADQRRAWSSWVSDPKTWPDTPCAATTPTMRLRVQRRRTDAEPSPAMSTRGAPTSSSVPTTVAASRSEIPTRRRYDSVTATSCSAATPGRRPVTSVSGSWDARCRVGTAQRVAERARPARLTPGARRDHHHRRARDRHDRVDVR